MKASAVIASSLSSRRPRGYCGYTLNAAPNNCLPPPLGNCVCNCLRTPACRRTRRQPGLLPPPPPAVPGTNEGPWPRLSPQRSISQPLPSVTPHGSNGGRAGQQLEELALASPLYAGALKVV